MKTQKQMKRIRLKFGQLKKLDKNFESFGSAKHRYKLNRTVSESELTDFERSNNINLPIEYREFLMCIGNGGAGPYYGLEPLENGRFVDLGYKDSDELIDLSKPFPHTEHWNLDSGEITDENEEEYFNNKWVNGLLRISNFGCGVSINLVVNGQEFGNVWVDDRCNQYGIYPDPYFKSEGRLTFLNWYEAWLDEELNKRKDSHNSSNVMVAESVDKSIDTKTSLWFRLKSWWS